MAASRTVLVRVCPYDPRRGFTARTFVRDGERITEQWREMSTRRVAELRLLEQRQENGIQPFFQICSREEALALEAQALDTGKTSVLNATRSSRVRDLNNRSAAVAAELAKQAAIATSAATEDLITSLAADLDAKEAEEATAEAEASRTPPPAPTPRRRKRS